jgi:hypothetical protein
MEANQAASELTEDHVLNFLVNTLDEEIDIETGGCPTYYDIFVYDRDAVSHMFTVR